MEAASRAEFEPLSPDPVEPTPPPPSRSARPAEPEAGRAAGSPAASPSSPPTLPPSPSAAPGALPSALPSPTPSPKPGGVSASATLQMPSTPPPSAAAPAAAAPASPAVMDRDFIARNQIVERYLSGKLPIRGATEFERFCSEHPELLDEIGLPERVNAGLRLLEASGKPEPWHEEPKRFWEKPYLAIGLGIAAIALAIATVTLARQGTDARRQIAALTQQVADQPLDPATSTRTIRLLPSSEGASNTPVVTIGGGGETQLVKLEIDMTHSQYRQYRITIDRIDQGRVAIIDNLAKDSNGHLRIALNSSALGPGTYQFTIEGLDWRGQPQPDSWLTIAIQH